MKKTKISIPQGQVKGKEEKKLNTQEQILMYLDYLKKSREEDIWRKKTSH